MSERLPASRSHRAPSERPRSGAKRRVVSLLRARRPSLWLARSYDLGVWTNQRDAPVPEPVPGGYDARLIALNQILRHGGRYYASYHGKGEGEEAPWTVNLAWSEDLVHWKKCPENQLLPAAEDLSSGLWVETEEGLRLYTAHGRIDVHLPTTRAYE